MFIHQTNGGHPDYGVGDAFSFSLTFDDSNVDVSRPDGVTVYSILSSELYVKGDLIPHFAPVRMGLYENDFGPDFFFESPGEAGGNTVLLNPSLLPFMLEIFSFSDFLLLDGITFLHSDFTLSSPSSLGPTRGPVVSISVQVVPEPSTVALMGVAGMGLVLGLRRHRKA